MLLHAPSTMKGACQGAGLEITSAGPVTRPRGAGKTGYARKCTLYSTLKGYVTGHSVSVLLWSHHVMCCYGFDGAMKLEPAHAGVVTSGHDLT